MVVMPDLLGSYIAIELHLLMNYLDMLLTSFEGELKHDSHNF